LLTLNASEQVSATALAAEHRAFGRHFATRIPTLPPLPLLPLAGRRLRVGFVSADFRRHAVATFFQPLLAELDRAELEVFCYYNQPRGDEVTARIRDLAEHFVQVAGLPDRVLAERIRQDGIDVLVDLGGHTADNRLPVFFQAPAPVQVGWLGYLGPTGVPTLAWRVTDAYADVPAVEATAGLEAAWRLPHTLWCYEPYPEAPPPGPLPCTRDGVVTFGCLNNPGKVGPTMLAAWIELLRSVPNARLKLLTAPEAAREQALLAQFAAAGVAPARIDLLARMPVAQYLQVYRAIDIALDTWPYTGGTTTCDALWMGVPVVTLASERPFARSGASILAQIGLAECVTHDTAAYIACARAFAEDTERLATLRATLRASMLASPLLDAKAFAQDFTQALYAMWQHKAGAAPGLQP
jgi:predicted O-linked N-acetylglucosamine transferase (SPINDLY family)